jgi:hypothetical protein
MFFTEGAGHRIVSFSTKTGNDPKHRHPSDYTIVVETMPWEEDDHDSAEYSDDEFFSVDNMMTKSISEDTKEELSDNHPEWQGAFDDI